MKKPKIKKPPVALQTIRTPNGTIRRGQRRPFKKSTNEEMELRINAVVNEIAAHPFIHDGELKAWIKDTFKLDWHQAVEYINRARKLIVKRASIPPHEARDIVSNFLFDTMRNGTKVEALRATEQIRSIYGLDAPKDLRIGDPNGNPIKTTVVAPTVVFNIPNNHREKNGG